MGISTHVVGFVPPDLRWQRMRDVWNSCKAAGIAIPLEVETFFGGEAPDVNGVEVGEKKLREVGALSEWGDDGRSGYEIELSKLPKDIKVLRFWNSW